MSTPSPKSGVAADSTDRSLPVPEQTSPLKNAAEDAPAAPDPALLDYRPAWKSSRALTLFLFVFVSGLTLDLWSKHWAFHTLRQGGHEVIVPHVLEFQTMFNKGALFGIGAGKTELFLTASCLALVLVSWMFIRSDARRWMMHIALAGILAGAMGNMYDRVNVRLRVFNVDGQPLYLAEQATESGDFILREYPPDAPNVFTTTLSAERREELHQPIGMVRDFIKIPTKLWGNQDLWPWVFNVADMLLVGGVSILAIFLWRDGAEPKVESEAADGASSGVPPPDKPLTDAKAARSGESTN